MLLGLCNPRLTTLKPNSLRFAGAERNRRELTSSDNIGKIRFTFSSQFLFVICRDSSPRSEEHTSELQSRFELVCRLLLEKKKKQSPDNLRRHQMRRHAHTYSQRY